MNNKIGNITRVKWHYVNRKYALNRWGHARETFDENSLIDKTLDPSEALYNSSYPVFAIDDRMCNDKNYACIRIIEGKIYIRNLFDNNNSEGFDQKNIYFEDKIAGMFELEDTNNMLLSYINLGYKGEIHNLKEKTDIIYFCVEYNLCNDINMVMLCYCISLESQIKLLNDKVKILEDKSLKNEENNSKKWFNFMYNK